MSSEWRPCILIPVYNHEAALARVLTCLKNTGLPVILVNDGSRPSCRELMLQLARNENVELLDLPENRGKGAAVKAGLCLALDLSYSHALQIDADGQHAAEDVDKFLAAGRQLPTSLVSGLPVYGKDIPTSRYYGRYLTHFWVVVNTVSRQIKDSMCGFRLYPLVEIVPLIKEEFTGNRMDFDTEVMVRWVWRGGRVVHIPTKVNYPLDGISHFRMCRDNLLITKMHTRLFFGMLLRLPRLISRALSAWKAA